MNEHEWKNHSKLYTTASFIKRSSCLRFKCSSIENFRALKSCSPVKVPNNGKLTNFTEVSLGFLLIYSKGS